MWWVQSRVHYGAWSPGVRWGDDYWWVPFPPCTGAWRPVAGMCKLDQVSPLRPGEASYHNQGWDMRPPVNNTIHQAGLTSANIHFYLFAFIIQYWSLGRRKIFEYQEYILPACKVPAWWWRALTTDQGEEMSALCSKFRIPVSSSPFRGQGRHLRGYRLIRVIGFMVMVYCSQFVNSKNMEGWCLKRAGPFWKLIYKVITRTRPGLTPDTG